MLLSPLTTDYEAAICHQHALSRGEGGTFFVVATCTNTKTKNPSYGHNNILNFNSRKCRPARNEVHFAQVGLSRSLLCGS